VVDEDKPLPKTLFPFIWHFLREYKAAVIVYVALAIVAGFWGPFNSMLIKQVINLLPNVSGGYLNFNSTGDTYRGEFYRI
jgi:ATP-binding cassette subfamily B protein